MQNRTTFKSDLKTTDLYVINFLPCTMHVQSGCKLKSTAVLLLSISKSKTIECCVSITWYIQSYHVFRNSRIPFHITSGKLFYELKD